MSQCAALIAEKIKNQQETLHKSKGNEIWTGQMMRGIKQSRIGNTSSDFL